MVTPIAGQALDVVDLEREIEAQFRRSPSLREQHPGNFAPATVRAPSLTMPEYVEHRDGATEIGKLTAEAIVREYETAVKEIEEMGAQLIECAKKCEAMTRDVLAATDEMKQTAARYRQEAKRIFVQIENCTVMTAEVRKTCTELKEKIAAPPTVKA